VIRSAFIAAALFAVPAPASAQSVNADDSSACRSGSGPAIEATIVGLKDRTGRLKLELYPGTEADFLKDDRDLVREGKFFRRVWSATPARGPVVLCIRAPSPGRYALLFTHDRDGRNKFNFWKDGAGFPSNTKLGRSRPKVAQALIAVGPGITKTTIRAQYLRGLSGFAPHYDD
jgi:uncharacterized protein (DUF2141 family)